MKTRERDEKFTVSFHASRKTAASDPRTEGVS
jgi:hypothetical protein